MAEHCILHIGPSKTGSTSIQHTLFHELIDPAFVYADMGKTNHGTFFQGMFAKNLGDILGRRGHDLSMDEIAGIRENSAKQFDRAIAAAGGSTLIFSSEGISGLETDELARIKNYLDRHFARITVVGYMRDPAGLIQSTYQERIKTTPVPLDFAQLYRPYRRRYERFDTLFGRDNVMFWPFAPATFRDGNVVEHFFRTLGIAAPDRYRWVNESLSKPVVQMLYAYHRHAARGDLGRVRGARKRRLMREFAEFEGEKFRFAAEIMAPAIARNRADVAWIEERMGARFAPPPDDDAAAIRNEADMLAVAPEAVAELERRVAVHGPLPERSVETPLYVARLMAVLLGAIDVRRGQEGEA